MSKTAKTLLWLGALVAVILLIWAMFDNSVTLGRGPADTTAEGSTANSEFASEVRNFDRSANSIDFDSDFSSSEIDAALDAQ